MARKALSQQEIYDLYKAAEGGSQSALSALNDVSSYYGKKANERMREFEKADVSSQALKRAEHFTETQLGRSNFARGKKLDAWEAYKNASEARQFLRAKTGTVAKERKRMDNVIDKLQKESADRGWQLPEGIETGQARKDFETFLKSAAWDEIKNTMGSQTMKEVAEGITEGKDVEDLLQAYQDSLEDDDFSFQDFVEEWASEDY